MTCTWTYALIWLAAGVFLGMIISSGIAAAFILAAFDRQWKLAQQLERDAEAVLSEQLPQTARNLMLALQSNMRSHLLARPRVMK